MYFFISTYLFLEESKTWNRKNFVIDSFISNIFLLSVLVSHLPSMLIPISGAVLSHLSHVRPFVTLWTVACQVPLSMGSPRKEYWGGLPFLLQGIFPTQRWNPNISCIGWWVLYH